MYTLPKINQRVFTSALVVLFISSIHVLAQTTVIRDFVMYSGNGRPGATVPSSPGYGVILGSSTNIQSGSVGSAALVQTTGSATIATNIYSGGRVILANGNTVNGRINATAPTSTVALQVGSNTNLSGQIDINGNITVQGGVVTGRVTHPVGTTYTGPVPAGGEIIGPPSLVTLPTLPTPTTFPAFGTTDFTGNATISPGNYRDINLGGNRTITFNGPGTYVFRSIRCSGTNTFSYNFPAGSTGNILVYVHQDVDVNKLNSVVSAGSTASRIYYEIQGNGSTTASGNIAFNIANGSSGGNNSKWNGTVYAPFGAIMIGSGTGSCQLSGALWSGTQVTVNTGVSIQYTPFGNCTPPNANAGPDKVLTCSQNTTILNGSSTTSGVSFSWTGPGIMSGGTTATPTVNAAGTYILTVTGSTCSAVDTVIVTSNQVSPNVNAGSDQTITCSFPSVTLNGSSTTSGATFLWTSLSGTGITSTPSSSSISVNQTGTYILTVTNPANGCTARDTALVNSNILTPNVNAGPDQTLTCSITSVSLNGSSTTSGVSYSWSSLSGTGITSTSNTATITVNQNGTYVLTVTNPTNGCFSRDTAVVNSNTTSPNVNAGADQVITCSASSVTLNGSSTTSNVTYNWTSLSGTGITSPSNTAAISVNQIGSYVLTVRSSINGCTSTDTAVVTTSTGVPNANAGPDQTLSCSVTGVTLIGSSTTSGVSYNWSVVSGGIATSITASQIVHINNPGTYVLTVTNTSNGCQATDTVIVNNDIAVPNVSAGSDQVLTCSTTSVSLNGSSITPNVTYQWSSSVNGFTSPTNDASVTVNQTGTYILTVTSTTNGCSARDTALVSSNLTTPNLSINPAATITCYQPSVSLQAVSTTSNVSFSWNTSTGAIIGSTTGATVQAGLAAVYTVTATNLSNGCTSTSSVSVNANLSTPGANAGLDAELTCSNPLATLTASSPSSNISYSWSTFDDGTFAGTSNHASVNINGEGTFVVTVTNLNNGCISRDTAIVTRIPCVFPYYPPPPGGKSFDLIGSELNSLFAQFGAFQDTSEFIFRLNNDSVWIEIIYNEGQLDSLAALLQGTAYGLTDIIDNGTGNRILTGKFPVSRLTSLNSLPQFINYVRPVFPPITTSYGVVGTKGDTAMKSQLVKSGFRIFGDSVTVGVLSNSYNTILGNNALSDVLNGDLPGIGNPDFPTPVKVYREFPFGERSDEGRAMLQIIHDVAPASKLAFRTGFISAGDFAKGIRQLADSGCDVIVDDITYITEPYFKDGLVAKAANYADSLGIPYFTSAGNYGDKSYAADFLPFTAPSTVTGMAHDFSGSGDIFQNIALTPGNYMLVMQWEDSIYSIGSTTSGTTNDMDIFLTYDNGKTLFGFNRNNLGGDPLEVLPFIVTQNTNVNIMIVRAAGSGPVKFKYIAFRGDPVINEYNQGTSTIVGQGNAAGAITIAASYAPFTPGYNVANPVVEFFSSRGGTPVNGVVRNKPDFTGPDGVNTNVATMGVDLDGDGFSNFFGTSAAAPHAAAVAALLMNGKKRFYNQDLSTAELKQILRTTAVDMYTPGHDFNSGYGFIDADAAMRTFAAPVPQISNVTVPSGSTPGTSQILVTVDGNYLTTSSVVWVRGVPVQTSYVNSTTLLATLPAFGVGNPPIQIYNPPLIPGGNDGGLSNEFYLFSPVKKNVVIKADNKTKKYGEIMPVFTSSITVDGVRLDSSGYTLSDLGISSITYTSPASSSSNTGIYFIRPFTDTASIAIGYKDLFNYSFVDGLLSITKMPLLIRPKDTTITYGSMIGDFEYNYVYDNSNIDPANQNDFLNSIQAAYTDSISNVLAFIDGRVVTSINGTSGRVVTSADLSNLAMIASGRVVTSATIASGRVVTSINGTNNVVIDTMYLAQISPSSLYGYQDDPANTTLISPDAGVNARGLLNGRVVTSATATANGRVVTSATANSSDFDTTSNANVAIIIDETDLFGSSDVDLSALIPMNLITGTTVGSWFIVPAAFLSNNFEINYAIGNLNILPATLTVKADTATAVYGATPVFTSQISGYRYNETPSQVFTSGPSYTVLNSSNTVVSSNYPVGTYQLVPGSLNLIQPTNYLVQYQSSPFTVTKADLTITADNKTKYVGENNPPLTMSYSGFVYNENSSFITPPNISTTAGTNSVAGNYPISLSGGSAANYNLILNNGILRVLNAPSCTINAPVSSPICGLTGNLLDATTTNASSYSWSVSGSGWQITSGQGTSSILYTAGSGVSTALFTLTVSDLNGVQRTCSLSVSTRCEQYCAYSQGFWGNSNSGSCTGISSSALLNTLLTTPLTMGEASRTITFGTTEGSCLQTKMPSGSTSSALPVGNVSCAGATGNQYLSNNKFRSNLLGQSIALSLALRQNPALGNVRITGPFLTTYRATSCTNGNAVPGTKLVTSIPSSVVTYLGANNRVSDLLTLANKALGSTYSASGGNPTLTEIANAVNAFILGFDQCRILAGFSSSSAGVRYSAFTSEEENAVEEAASLPFRLYPNPASGRTMIDFVPERSSRMLVQIYNYSGTLMQTIMDNAVTEGELYNVEFDCSGFANGIYFIRMTDGETGKTQKLIIMR